MSPHTLFKVLSKALYLNTLINKTLFKAIFDNSQSLNTTKSIIIVWSQTTKQPQQQRNEAQKSRRNKNMGRYYVEGTDSEGFKFTVTDAEGSTKQFRNDKELIVFLNKQFDLMRFEVRE